MPFRQRHSTSFVLNNRFKEDKESLKRREFDKFLANWAIPITIVATSFISFVIKRYETIKMIQQDRACRNRNFRIHFEF